MGFKDIIKKIFRIKTEIALPIDEDLIKRDEHIRALIMAKTAREAQIAELKAKEREEKEQRKQKDKQIELAERLSAKERSFVEEDMGSTFSFKKFMIDMKKYGKKKSIEIVDKNDEEVLGIFGDLITIGDDLGITDIYGNIIVRGKNIHNIIYKPRTLQNQIRRGKISIPMVRAKNGKLLYLHDIENIEHPDLRQVGINDEGKNIYQFTEENMGTVKNLLIEKEEIISDLRKEKEVSEVAAINLKNELDDSIGANIVLRNQIQNMQSRVSEAMQLSMQFDTRIGDIQQKITHLTELKALYENTIHRLENVIGNMLEKGEALGVKTKFQREFGEFIDIMEVLKGKIAPETQTIIQQIKPEEAGFSVQPGQPLKR